MTGMPGIWHFNSGLTADKAWKIIMEGDAGNYQMASGCCQGGLKTTYDITGGHAYAIIGGHEVQDKSGKRVRLVKVRDPWGTEKYSGPWNDKDENWTPELKAKFDMVNKNDGIFYVPIDIFLKVFKRISYLYYRKAF